MKFLKTSRLNYTAETAMTKTCKEVQKKMKLTSDKTLEHLAKMHLTTRIFFFIISFYFFFFVIRIVCVVLPLRFHKAKVIQNSKHEKAITFLLLQDLPFICCFLPTIIPSKLNYCNAKMKEKISFPNALCLKITQSVAFEFKNFGIFHQFLSY